MIQGGGIISSVLGLIKEKEKQGDKALDRLHDGLKTQMELTTKQGSWTGAKQGSWTEAPTAPAQVVKEKAKEPIEEEEPAEEEEESESTPETSEPAEENNEENIADMGIISLAQSAS